MRKILLLLIITLGIIFCFEIRAQVSLSVSPQKLDIVLFPGDIYQGKFKITNHSQISIPISIKALPFGAKEGTGELEFEEIEKDSPVFWFSFEKTEMILEPNETKRVNFEIRVPQKTEPGGYFVFIYFEPRFPKEYFEGSGPKVIPIIGVPVLISTTELKLEPEKGKEIEVLSFSIPKKERINFLENSFKFVYEQTKLSLAAIGVVEAIEGPEILVTKKTPDSFLATIKNNDIYHLKPSGKILIFDIFGEKIGEGELKGETILPGKTRNFEIKLNEKKDFSLGQILSFILFGKTKAKLEIKAESPVRGEVFPIQSNIFLTFYSLNSMYFGLVFVIIILLVVFGRKRILLSLKILFSSKKT